MYFPILSQACVVFRSEIVKWVVFYLCSLPQNMWADGVLVTQAPLVLTTAINTTCPNGVQWVLDILKECAQDGRDMASVYLGLFSILCFMVSSLP